jgi:hypothetical protein
MRWALGAVLDYRRLDDVSPRTKNTIARTGILMIKKTMASRYQVVRLMVNTPLGEGYRLHDNACPDDSEQVFRSEED